MTLTLYCQLLNHVMGKNTAIPNNMECYISLKINEVIFIDSCPFMLSSLNKLSSNLNKDQFNQTRKYLQSIYVQQPNQSKANNVTEGGEEGETMQVNEDYWNHPSQPPTLTSD